MRQPRSLVVNNRVIKLVADESSQYLVYICVDAVSKKIFFENLIHAGLDGDIVDLELAERPQAKLIISTNKGLM